MRLIQVAVPIPQLDALTYAVPAEFPDPVSGARVLVPLGKRTLTGVVVGVITESRVAIRDSRFEEFQDNESQPDVTDVQAAKDEPRTANRDSTPNRDPRPATRDSIREIVDILDDSAFLPPDVVSL